LLKYHEIADPEIKAQIEEMVVAFADFWKRIGYVQGYFGTNWGVGHDTMSYNAIFCMLNAAAYHFTGEQKYLDEASWFYGHARWNTVLGKDMIGHEHHFLSGIPYQIDPPMAAEEDLWPEGNIHVQFVIVSAYYIDKFTDLIKNDTRTSLSNVANNWLDLWPYGIFVDGDGSNREDTYAPFYFYIINKTGPNKGQWRPAGRTPVVSGRIPFSDPFFASLNEVRWNEPLSRFVAAAELIYPSLDETGKQKAKDIVLGILNNADDMRLHWMYDYDGGTNQIEPSVRYMYNMLSSEAPASYIIAYWLGKSNGMIE
jgi:hypothetical protein